MGTHSAIRGKVGEKVEKYAKCGAESEDSTENISRNMRETHATKTQGVRNDQTHVTSSKWSVDKPRRTLAVAIDVGQVWMLQFLESNVVQDG